MPVFPAHLLFLLTNHRESMSSIEIGAEVANPAEDGDLASRPGALAVLEIGGTSIKLGFADGGKPLPFTRIVPTSTIRVGEPIRALAGLLREGIDAAGVRPVLTIVTVPGFIGLDSDRVLSAANIPELNGRALASELTAEIGMPVQLERDVVLQLLGESHAGSVRGERHVLAVYFGTGIGAAYLGDGAIFRGAGWALEIGHMPMHGLGRDLPGLRTDCAEVYASGRTLSAIAERHQVDVATLFAVAAADSGLRDELTAVVRDQAFAVASAVALLSPNVVLIGGGVVRMDRYPRDLLAKTIEAHLPLPMSVNPVSLRWASLGWEAALWGAIVLSLRDANG